MLSWSPRWSPNGSQLLVSGAKGMFIVPRFGGTPQQIGPSMLTTFPVWRDDSTIARFLRERGPGVHHVSFEVEDLDQAVAELAQDGVNVVHRIEYPEGVSFEGHRWREAFVHPRVAFGLLLHVCEKKPL